MRFLLGVVPLTLVSVLGCSGSDEAGTEDDALTSHEAKFVDFQFEGEVVSASGVNARQAIIAQLFYVEGRLTHLGGNARAGFVRVTQSSTGDVAGGQLTKYKVELPVLWPAHQTVPRQYRVVVPKKVDAESLNAFNAKYDGRCGKNEYGQETFWHDFDSEAQGCTLDDDALVTTARVVPSAGAINDLYPEYDKIYSDGAIKIVSVFGLDGGETPTDKGVQVFERFVRDMKSIVPNAREASRDRGDFILRDLTLTGEVHGKKLQQTLLLIDQAQYATQSFTDRFAEATKDADVVTYDGHSGLGKNLRALTSRGSVERGQYQVWFLDGCNSLGYVDDSFAERRRQTNGAADPTGTKFADLIGNALPSYWPSDESTTFKVVRALANPEEPKSYGKILEEFPTDQVAAVVGDEDNSYRP